MKNKVQPRRSISCGCRFDSAVLAATLSAILAMFVPCEVAKANPPANTLVTTVAVGYDPGCLAVTPDSGLIYVTNLASNTVTVINASLDTVIATIAVGNSPDYIAITPDGKTAFVANSQDSTVSVISAANNTVTNTVPVSLEPVALAVTPDGTKLYVANYGGKGGTEGAVSILDTTTLATLNKISTNRREGEIRFSADGKFAYVLDEKRNGSVSKIDTASEKIVRKIGGGYLSFSSGLALSPDGSTLYVADPSAHVEVFSTKDGSHLKQIKVFPSSVPIGTQHLARLGLTPDGKYLYVADFDQNYITMINTATERRSTPTILVGGNQPLFVAAAPDGKRLYVTGFLAAGYVSVLDIEE